MDKTTTKHKFSYEWKISDGYPADGIEYHGRTVFSCFACGGGSTMGYKRAGYNVLGCNEIDPKMMKAYRANHKPKYSFLEPIQEFKDREDLPEELYNLDILDGSPPCSSFSLAGNREKDWGKKKKFREGQAEQVLDTLFFDYIELAKRLQPKVVIAENVEGLLQGDARTYLKKVYDDLQDAGYYVQHFLLDSQYMGVPQRRKRVFVIGLRNDLAGPFLKQVDFFRRLPELDLYFNEPKIPFGQVRDDEGADYKDTERGQLMDKRIETDQSIADINLRLFDKNSGFNSSIIHDHEVAPTITAQAKCWRMVDGMACSDWDYSMIGTFPTDYKFEATSKHGPKYIIGMSVPPVMMAQIAHRIYEQWLVHL